ncbi:recombinase family protein [Amycolatopsis thermoflava]|uniref:recombinase family protein n=1 Tax=Amycolatopsis thermoflava TaxID=84480 RepID=UPI000406A2B3|nr:recombinase family protein [Amycolatopsis thermoflava]
MIYCRISSDPTGRAAGVQRQETECRELAERLGWEVVDVLVDNDISAHSGKRRPAYEQLLDAISLGKIDAFVAWHADRLYRRTKDLQQLIDIVNLHKVQIRTVTSGDIDLTTATGRAVAKTVATWNEHEVEHAIERMKLAKSAAASEGRWLGGGRPFGFEDDGVTVRESEASEIVAAVRRVLMGGSLLAIASEWNERGLLTARGKEWSQTTVRRLLLRARNAGLVEYNGEIVGPAQWPAIVPEHEWQAVRRLLSDPSRQTAFTRDRKYLGSGLYLCGLCEDGSTVHAHTGGRGGRPHYRCKKPGRHQLIRGSIPVDEYVTSTVAEILGHLAKDGALRLAPPGSEDLSALYAEAASIRAELDAARQALANHDIDLKSFVVASKQWQADLDAVEARLERHGDRQPLALVMNAPDPVAEFQSDRLPIDVKRAVIGRLVKVTLLRTKQGRLPGGRYFDPASVVIEPRRAGSHG